MPPRKEPKQPEIVHKEFITKIASGKNGLTAEQVKTLFGWEEQPDGVEWKEGTYHAEVSACFPKKVRMTKNMTNRPFYASDMKGIAQEILNKKYAGPNGLGTTPNNHTIGIGEYGNVLEGQHRGVAVVYAEYCRLGLIEPGRAHHWKALWPEPIKIDTIIVYGMSESDALFRTLNTGKPASFGDTQYRAEWLQGKPPDDRKKIAKAINYAVKMVMERTGAGEYEYASRRTLSEMDDWLNRHPRLREAVIHMHSENKGGEVSKYMSPGNAAALMYLMAASDTNPDDYHHMRREGKAGEEYMDLGCWEQARSFWVSLCSTVKEFAALRNAKRPIGGTRDAHGAASLTYGRVFPGKNSQGKKIQPMATLAEQIAIICRAWHAYKKGKNPTEANIRLDYLFEPADGPTIDSVQPNDGYLPSFGGIDRGDEPAPIEEEEIEEIKEEVDEERERGQGGKPTEDETPEQERERRKNMERLKEIKEAASRFNQRKAGRQPGEVKSDGEVQYDKDGKPPAPTFKGKQTVSPTASNIDSADKVLAEIAKLKEPHGEVILLFSELGYVRAWANDAEAVIETLGTTREKGIGGVARTSFEESLLDDHIDSLIAAGYRVCVSEKGESGATVVSERWGSNGPPTKEEEALNEATTERLVQVEEQAKELLKKPAAKPKVNGKGKGGKPKTPAKADAKK